MRIVAWNCAMGFGRKLDRLLHLSPDVAVISEAAQPEAAGYLKKLPQGTAHLWVGKDPTKKGLLILGFGGVDLTMDSSFDPTSRYFAPVLINGTVPLRLLAVWSYSDRDDKAAKQTKPSPIIRALDRHADFLASGDPLVICGDFNHSVVWDRKIKRSDRQMSTILERLDRLDLVSLYHVKNAEQFGRESRPTIYWRDRREDGPGYHIDYLFIPADLAGRSEFGIGAFADWVGSGASDHLPIWADIEAL